MVWKVQGPTGVILATQDAPFKVQLDRKERVYSTKTKGPTIGLETSSN